MSAAHAANSRATSRHCLSLYAGFRTAMERASPVASSTSSSACPIDGSVFNESSRRILRLPNQETRAVGSHLGGFSEQRSITLVEGTRASETIRAKACCIAMGTFARDLLLANIR